MDPYRSSTTIAECPRCNGELQSDGQLRLACLAGCGSWYPRELIEHLVTWADVVRAARQQVTGWPWGAATCPGCKGSMTIALHDELRFDRCDAHGVWLDSGEDERFFGLFARR